MKTPYILATCLLACTLSAQAAPQTGTQTGTRADSQSDTLTSAQQQISATDNSGRNSQQKVEKLDDQTSCC